MTRASEGSTEDPPRSDGLPKAYQPRDVEPEVYERWLAADVFAPDGAGGRADDAKPPFVIVQPPPNVTGALHIGHALTATVEDLMVRRARMAGRPTLWLPGLDHASIAAQVVLDRILAREGESRASLGRDRYLERMWRFMDETRGVILDQQRRLGLSLDWGRLRFTMDAGSARAVRVSFKRLYDDGMAYRAERLVNWCPTCRTSVSDLEVIATPEKGTLWLVRYHLTGEGGAAGDETITVATTRPETILGDTAVAVHHDDDRYRHLVGRQVLIPFVDRVVPIIADAVVEPAFGTGAVKITPAHDHDDNETGRRHGLPSIEVLDDRAVVNENGAGYAGLPREEARRRVVSDLEARGDLVEARPHELVIGRCQRSDDVIEPRLKTQWFVRMAPLADRAMATVREGRTDIVPARFEKVFFDWLERIHDWNVSRQLWWGHRIPAWYCPDGHITVSDEEAGPPACGTCARPRAELRQDDDIFDTWYSSGLWPFSTLGWPDDTEDLRRFYPGTVMETGYDIIFFWVARMMMLGEWLTGQPPFGTVYLHGMVRDPYGQKMSKTKGNVIDPLAVMSEIGADALRFALISGTTPGNDQRLNDTRLEGARNFANKLWNAARFVLGARPVEIPVEEPLGLPAADALGAADHWILHRCAETIRSVTRAYDDLQFGEAARTLHDAIWSDYCDWYLELAKVQLAERQGGEARRVATWHVLTWVLDRYLRLLHPVMPFVTEAIWERLPHEPGDADLLIVAAWPDAAREDRLADATRARGVEQVLGLVRAVRTARAETGIDAASWIPADVSLPDADARAAYADMAEAVRRLARIEPTLLDPAARDARPGVGDERPGGHGERSITVVAGTAEARLLRPERDRERDLERLRKEIREARQALAATEARLADPRFVERAPPAVVDASRARAEELRDRVARLSAGLPT